MEDITFESFDIRRKSNDEVVPLKIIDIILRRKLALKDHESGEPFGHFYFPEPQEEDDDFPESFSWARLIHVIAYYSKIHYGKCSVYDVESAMAWTREYVLFPHSAYTFTEQMMKVLDKEGFYVFIRYRD